MNLINENEIRQRIDKSETFAVYIYTTMCGTCELARRMLTVVEAMDVAPIYEINGNFCVSYLQMNKIQSVPALVLYKKGQLHEIIFAFGDVINLKNKFSHLK